jgi:zinc transporter ZupT
MVRLQRAGIKATPILGAVVTLAVGLRSGPVVAALLPIAAGSLLYVAVVGLIPEVVRALPPSKRGATVAVMLIGAVVTILPVLTAK